MTHSVKTLLTLDPYHWRFSAQYGCKYMSMSGTLVITSVIAYKLQQIYLIELEKGKRIKNHQMEFGGNFFTSGNSFAFARQ